MKTNTRLANIDKIYIRMTVKDPFILGAHHLDSYPKGNKELGPVKFPQNWNKGSDFSPTQSFHMYHGEVVPGFPRHPHRGFETITVMEQGYTDHFDSVGNKGRYSTGDVQWLTAGCGIEHCEMFPLLNTDKENPFELFQIWLNLPAKDKKSKPDYKMFWNKDVPTVDVKDENGKNVNVRIVAGEYCGVKSLKPQSVSWAAHSQNKVNVWFIDFEQDAKFIIPKTSSTANRYLYCYRGNGIEIEGQILEKGFAADLLGGQEAHIQNGSERSKIMLLEGEPIGEPVVAYGPFVMNSQDEIIQTYEQYQRTQFGGWPWGTSAPVNGAKEGRFSSYAKDCRIERPEE